MAELGMALGGIPNPNRYDVVPAFTIDETSDLMQLRYETALTADLSREHIQTNIARINGYVDMGFTPEHVIANEQRMIVIATKYAPPISQTLIGEHLMQFNKQASDTTATERIIAMTPQEVAEFSVWHVKDLAAKTEQFQEQLPILRDEFMKCYNLLDLQLKLPMLDQKVMQQRLDRLEFRVSDVFTAFKGESAYAGSYSAKDGRHTISLASGYVGTDSLRKVIFHEMVHAVGGHTFKYGLDAFDKYDEDYMPQGLVGDDDILYGDHDARLKEVKFLEKSHAFNTTAFIDHDSEPMPYVYASRIGINQGEDYRWINEAATEHITQMLLSAGGFASPGIETFDSADMRRAISESGGSYQKNRRFTADIIDRTNLGQFMLTAFMKNHQPQRKQLDRTQVEMHKAFDAALEVKNSLPLLNKYVASLGIAGANLSLDLLGRKEFMQMLKERK